VARFAWSHGILGIGVLLAAGLVTGARLPASASAEGFPPLLRRALDTFAGDHRGTLMAERHLSFTLHAGPFSRDVSNDVGVVLNDGTYVRTKYYAQTSNGKTDDDATLRSAERDANRDLEGGRGFFKRPIDPRYADDYRFEPADCADCASGERTFAFTSKVRDEQHGDGIATVDEATAHVVALSYTLDKAPAHATSAHVVETFGQALPKLWTCVRVAETFNGRVGIIGGSASMHYTLDHFRRLAAKNSLTATIDEALASREHQ
jgi:hypothetical protein